MTRSGSSRIPVNAPALRPEETDAVAAALRDGWISSAGPAIEGFEQAWAEACGRRHGIAVANGTLALGLAVESLDLEPGDEVIMPTFTIISCAIAVVRAGAIPVLVDAHPDTWTMDPSQVEARISARTKAIMPVHIYGHPVDMAPVMHLAETHGLAVIEDAAEAHGASYRMPDGTWVPCGSFGGQSIFSFYANKLITTGEGGMIVTDHDQLAARLRDARNLYFGSRRRFSHDQLGTNARITNMQAALGLPQVHRIEEIVERKRAIGRAYRERLGQDAGIQLQAEEPWARSVYWMVGLVLEDELGIDAAALAARLDARGIETRPFFEGMHTQPALLKEGLFAGESYPVADRLTRQGLYLPSGLALTDEEIDRVCAAVHVSLEGTA